MSVQTADTFIRVSKLAKVYKLDAGLFASGEPMGVGVERRQHRHPQGRNLRAGR